MKNLSKSDYARRDEIIDKFRNVEGAIDDAYEAIVASITKYNDELLPAYNEVVAEAQGWVADIASSIEEFMSNKSDKWLEGERGQAYGEWLSEWQSFELEELAPFDLPEQPDSSHAGALEEGLPPEEVAE